MTEHNQSPQRSRMPASGYQRHGHARGNHYDESQIQVLKAWRPCASARHVHRHTDAAGAWSTWYMKL